MENHYRGGFTQGTTSVPHQIADKINPAYKKERVIEMKTYIDEIRVHVTETTF